MNGGRGGIAERRVHPRVEAERMSYVAGLGRPGLVVDISEGGLGVLYKGAEDLPEEVVVDLINATKNIFIDKIRCRKTRDVKKGQVTGFSYVQERRLGLQFLNPSEARTGALRQFMRIQV